MPKRVVLDLSPDEINVIHKAGGPTFRPLRGRRYRCNQVARLGRLTGHQCESVRRIASPHTHVATSAHVASYKILSAVIGQKTGLVYCPHCSYPARVNPGYTRCTSPNCRKEFMADAAPALLEAQWTPSYQGASHGNVYCPHCSAYNSSKPVGENSCTSCHKDFSAVRG